MPSRGPKTALMILAACIAVPGKAQDSRTAELPGSGVERQTPRCWPALAEVTERIRPGRLTYRTVRLHPEQSPSAEFASGSSLVEVVELPEFKRPYRVEFQLIFDINLSSDSEYLLPSAVLVDASFCELLDVGELTFEFKRSLMNHQGAEVAHVGVTNADPRFLLVYTDARKVGEPAVLNTGPFADYEMYRARGGYTMVRIQNKTP